ncbi:hypothetical protein V1478_000474 [Vespula squamosa]|uniref:Uncharacterized protein n=1 Tax=Vespula squamosa TaxID=30214 RepID=A0ABD2C5L8_VESSQ
MLALYKCLVVGSRSSCFQDPIQTQLTSFRVPCRRLQETERSYHEIVTLKIDRLDRDHVLSDTFKIPCNVRLILRIGVPRQGFKAIDTTEDVAYCGVERREGGRGGGGGGVGGGGGGGGGGGRRRRAAAKCVF